MKRSHLPTLSRVTAGEVASSFNTIAQVELADRRTSGCVRQGRRLDQQALSFVAAARSAEAHDNRVSDAFRLCSPRQQRIARGQELEIIKADTVQTCRAGIFHRQEVTGFTASVALPLPVQWLDHHQLRGTACFLCQALAFPLGKLLRYPMGPVQRFDRRVTASAETQHLAPRVARDITRRAGGQAAFGRPGPKHFHGFRYARQVGLDRTFEAVDLTSPPLFQLPCIQPPDPHEHVDRACIALSGQCHFRGLDDTLRKCVPVLRVHRQNPGAKTAPTRGARPMFQPLFIEQRQIFKVLLTLFRPSIIAGLVPGADEAVAPATTIRRRIKAAARVFPANFRRHAILHSASQAAFGLLTVSMRSRILPRSCLAT
jgi:hypothetical protein